MIKLIVTKGNDQYIRVEVTVNTERITIVSFLDRAAAKRTYTLGRPNLAAGMPGSSA